jgi:hypothetical protein
MQLLLTGPIFLQLLFYSPEFPPYWLKLLSFSSNYYSWALGFLPLIYPRIDPVLPPITAPGPNYSSPALFFALFPISW